MEYNRPSCPEKFRDIAIAMGENVEGLSVREASILKNGASSFWKEYGGVAQLGEHLLCKQGVIGSIPFISTKGRKVRTTGGLTRYGLIAQPVRAHAW